MADAVSTQIIADAVNRVVAKITNTSDGTGESAVKKIDVSTLNDAPTELALERLAWSCSGMGVDLLWDGSTDSLIWHCPANTWGNIDFTRENPIPNDATGKTGDVNATTTASILGGKYSIWMFFRKVR